MRSISVVSAGQAADHVAMCGLNISYYDPRRKEVRIKQAARGGQGRVFRDKHIKAIVVRYSETGGDSNGVADMELIRKAGQRINKEITDFDASQNDMRHTGTPYLVEIMNRFDLLPVQNFRYGADPQNPQRSPVRFGRTVRYQRPGWLLVRLHHVLRAQRAALSPAHRSVCRAGGAGRWPGI